MSLSAFIDLELRLDVSEQERRQALATLRPLDRLAWLLWRRGGGDA